MRMSGNKLVEREGFEPPIPVSRYSGFQDRRIQPLCHLSVPTRYFKEKIFATFLLHSVSASSRKLVERKGFEPSIPVSQYTHLAGVRFRPLSHLSILLCVISKSGAPDRVRTYNLQIRSLMLYPIELRAHVHFKTKHTSCYET